MEFEISLNDLRFYAFHGVMEEEGRIGNEFQVSLSVFIPVLEGIENDDIVKTVSYVDLYEIVKNEMAITRKLLEKVALEIVEKIVQTYPVITKGWLRIEKMHPPIPGMLGSSSVTLNF